MRAPMDRPTLRFETSLPGVFALGDVRYGSVKRVASAAGEGGVAMHFVHEYLQASVDVDALGRHPAWHDGPAQPQLRV